MRMVAPCCLKPEDSSERKISIVGGILSERKDLILLGPPGVSFLACNHIAIDGTFRVRCWQLPSSQVAILCQSDQCFQRPQASISAWSIVRNCSIDAKKGECGSAKRPRLVLSADESRPLYFQLDRDSLQHQAQHSKVEKLLIVRKRKHGLQYIGMWQRDIPLRRA